MSTATATATATHSTLAPIGHKQLGRLVSKATGITGLFPKSARQGYMLCISIDVPIRANGRKIGTRTERHIVRFTNDGFADQPETFGCFLWGECDAVKMLLLNEIKLAKKHGQAPQMRLSPAQWHGDGSERYTMQATFPSGITKTIYTLAFDNHGCNLSIFNSAEPSGQYGQRSWYDSEEIDNVDEFVTHYEFSSEAL